MTRRPMQAFGAAARAVAGLGTRARWRHRPGTVLGVARAELEPAAGGRCELVAVRPPAVVVAARDAATAQELRLHGSLLLDAFRGSVGGERVTELRVVVRSR